MTESLKAGDVIHFLESGLSIPESDPEHGDTGWGHVARQWETVTVTDALIENSRDRRGRSWLDLIDDPAGQVKRWGRQMFTRGEAPEGSTVGADDAATMYRAWLAEYKVALDISHPTERKAEIQRLREKYGEFAGQG